MYSTKIYKTSIWNNHKISLEVIENENLKDLIKNASDAMQKYINNGTVNDYTSFASADIIVKGKLYNINNNKLIYQIHI